MTTINAHYLITSQETLALEHLLLDTLNIVCLRIRCGTAETKTLETNRNSV